MTNRYANRSHSFADAYGSAATGSARPSPIPFVQAACALTGIVAGLTGIATLYLAKCAAGINVLPGQAPLLHDLFYHLVR